MKKILRHVWFLLKRQFISPQRRVVKWNMTRLKRKVIDIVWNSSGKYFNEFSSICGSSKLWYDLQYTWKNFKSLVKRIEEEFNIKLSREKTEQWDTVDDIIGTVAPMVLKASI